MPRACAAASSSFEFVQGQMPGRQHQVGVGDHVQDLVHLRLDLAAIVQDRLAVCGKLHPDALVAHPTADAADIGRMMLGPHRGHPHRPHPGLDRHRHRRGIEPADRGVQAQQPEHLDAAANRLLRDIRPVRGRRDVTLEHDRPHPGRLRQCHDLHVIQQPRAEIRVAVDVHVDGAGKLAVDAGIDRQPEDRRGGGFRACGHLLHRVVAASA